MNRFVAEVELGGEPVTVHVKNTGRCKELLLPGAVVYLARGEGISRKTAYDIIAVEKASDCDTPTLINMDSAAPNAAAAEWLQGGLFSVEARVFREVTYGSSRFDFYIEDGERRIFLEVKGVTLESGGVAEFPDAPTQRGVKHIKELCTAIADGYEACVLFVIQMKGVRMFRPNYKTHPEFGEALRLAKARGLNVLAWDCTVSSDEMRISEPVRVEL